MRRRVKPAKPEQFENIKIGLIFFVLDLYGFNGFARLCTGFMTWFYPGANGFGGWRAQCLARVWGGQDTRTHAPEMRGKLVEDICMMHHPIR